MSKYQSLAALQASYEEQARTAPEEVAVVLARHFSFFLYQVRLARLTRARCAWELGKEMQGQRERYRVQEDYDMVPAGTAEAYYAEALRLQDILQR